MSEPSNPFARLAAPSLDDFTALAHQAFAALPEVFRRLAGDVVFRIEDFGAQEMLDELGLDDPFALTGLYSGDDPLHRSVLDPTPVIPMVFLYRRPILDEWAERGDVTLGELVTHVLVHEIGHHFGLSDADIEAIEDQA
jgi:predicted Zn-dependent protease with MMP-like domain